MKGNACGKSCRDWGGLAMHRSCGNFARELALAAILLRFVTESGRESRCVHSPKRKDRACSNRILYLQLLSLLHGADL